MARRGLIGDVNPDVLLAGRAARVAPTVAEAVASALLRPHVVVADGPPGGVGLGCDAVTGALPLPRPDGRLQCQRRGCGLLYSPDTNTESSCAYHPGKPVFVEAMKEWSCCGARGATFSEFAALKGCTLWEHTQDPDGEDAEAAAAARREARRPNSKSYRAPPRAGLHGGTRSAH